MESTCLVDNENDLDNQLDDSSAGLNFKLFEKGPFDTSDESKRCVLRPFGQSGYSNLKRTLNKSFGKVIADSVVKRSAEEPSDNDTGIEETKPKQDKQKGKDKKKDKDKKKNKEKIKSKKDRKKRDKRNEFVDELMKVFQSSDRRIDILEEKVHRQTLEIGRVSNYRQGSTDQGSVERDESSWDGPLPSSSSGRDGTRTSYCRSSYGDLQRIYSQMMFFETL